MSKRKAPRDENFLIPSSSSQNSSQLSTQVLNEQNNVSSPKKKRFSQNYSDLSQLNDISSSKSLSNARPGVIEQVRLSNFKCHSELSFNLHPYINFILGRNGSGKSAVMDAIILCLGGKATSTGRQASAKTFIKTNCDKAELRVVIRNEGEEAYKSHLYGSKIIVERKISRDGSSQYKIMNEKNKLISNKKSELDSITEQFNIQVENPVCFLNQETSKHFLNSSNKSDKYKLFMKASQLESMRLLQEQIEQQRMISKNLIEEKEHYLPRLQEDLYQWEEKYKKCQSVEKLKQKQACLMQEFSWASVIRLEKNCEKNLKEKRQAEKMRDKYEEKINSLDSNHSQSNQEYEKIKSEITDLTQLAKLANQKQDQINITYRTANQNYKQTSMEIKKLNALIDKKRREQNEIKKKLNEEKQSSKADYESERLNKESKIEEIKKKLSDLNAIEKFKLEENKRYSFEIERHAKALTERKFDIDNQERLIRNMKNDIESLKNARNDQIYKFGDFMPNLVADIKRHYEMGKFREMPRGPIGMYIQPKSDEWSVAIESCLGPLLGSFVCGGYEDESLLQQLFFKHIKHVKKRPRIIVTDFKSHLHNTTRYRPEDTRYPTVYEMLNIKDTVIANTLIDHRRVESILLLPDRSTVRQVIEDSRDQNTNEAFSKNGDQFYSKPSFKMYACSFKEARIFIKDSERAIQHKQTEIDKIIKSITNANSELSSLKSQIDSNKQLKSQNDKQIDHMRREQLQLNHKLKEVESINIPEPVDIKVFEDEIEQLEEEVDAIRKQIDQVEENSVEKKTQFEQARAEMEKNELEMNEISQRIDQLKEKFNQFDKERSEYKDAVGYYKKLIVQLEPKLKETENSYNSSMEELDKLIQSASELCPRIESKKSPESLDEELRNVEKQIKLTEKLHGNEEEITRKYIEMRSKYKRIADDIKKQHKFLDSLEKALRKREDAMALFTESKALRCAMDFSNYLNSREYQGTLKFDHHEQKLDIIVNPSKSREGKEAKDLKSLSGGERSFSTVSFLLALWSIVECPILFLDEFDVFMDQINRSIAMDLILSAAKEKLNGQYVFLTPQEMGSINPDQYVKMFKMPDPKRAIDLLSSNQENEEN
uniref:Structural maintenance of chromosomes protein 6 n=1 Tax=Brachionus koreanus TaxID=1199090 RepID=A0A7G7WNI9_9BILA|nr:structural maintenance of chromosomes protein 6 [Brachionus koreanus]